MNYSSDSEENDSAPEPSELEWQLAENVAIEDAKYSMYAFMKRMWSVVEPGVDFKEAWHLKAIAEHLECVTFGPGHPLIKSGLIKNDSFVRNLLINVPPGHAKSLAVCVFWPAWVWIHWPSARFMFASYADVLSIRDSVKCRDLIRSSQYRNDFQIEWDLADDSDQKSRFINTKKGYRIATSVGGSGTGERADFIVADDPLNAIQANSPAFRDRANDWWFKTMSTRDADPKTSRRVVVMQRLHEQDVSGLIIKAGDYCHLMLPAEFEPDRKAVTAIGWEDPRTVEGELLWPEQFGPIEIVKAKKDLGTAGFSGQMQQSPVPASGGLFKRHWWKFWTERPMGKYPAVQFWDCAEKPGITNDYSVCATWMITPTGYYLLDLWREKVESPQLQAAVQTNYEKWKHLLIAVVIEDKSAGTSTLQWARQKTKIPVIAFDPSGQSKEVRASAATPTVEAGNCYLPTDHPVIEDFISEHEKFPKGAHDDTVDTTSMMVMYTKTMSVVEPRIRSL